MAESKVELTTDQIALLLEIIDREAYLYEKIPELKQKLLLMLKQKQSPFPGSESITLKTPTLIV